MIKGNTSFMNASGDLRVVADYNNGMASTSHVSLCMNAPPIHGLYGSNAEAPS